MEDNYIYCGTQKLRCGYTTGSCAAAAAKAAAFMLITGKKIDFSDIITPDNTPLHIQVLNPVTGGNFASCAVIKDGGDDPDVTSGLEIYARVSQIPHGIEIVGGLAIVILGLQSMLEAMGFL